MPRLKFQQPIEQLEKRKGGYYFLKINAAVVNQFENRRATRLKCAIEQSQPYSCGLNHLGDGNFYIIVATRKLKSLDKNLGDSVAFEIYEDPNPLGVAIPDVLETLLEQDGDARSIFDKLTDGKKRSLIYSINKIKDVDKKIERMLMNLSEHQSKNSPSGF